MTRAFCCAAKAIARITSAMTSEVPTASTGAPGHHADHAEAVRAAADDRGDGGAVDVDHGRAAGDGDPGEVGMGRVRRGVDHGDQRDGGRRRGLQARHQEVAPVRGAELVAPGRRLGAHHGPVGLREPVAVRAPQRADECARPDARDLERAARRQEPGAVAGGERTRAGVGARADEPGRRRAGGGGRPRHAGSSGGRRACGAGARRAALRRRQQVRRLRPRRPDQLRAAGRGRGGAGEPDHEGDARRCRHHPHGRSLCLLSARRPLRACRAAADRRRAARPLSYAGPR